MAPKTGRLIAKADADIKRKRRRKIFIGLVHFKSARDAKNFGVLCPRRKVTNNFAPSGNVQCRIMMLIYLDILATVLHNYF